ncbi:MAG: S-adenosyl-L-methionine-dependent tRNA 4-demethylwyosine synthase [Methanosaeta sp. PtaU1.Bin060]|nr:MAG: S-adenosyl-L-methionine-dependent tRNA 4-demethylwyosine synthase [Methanosaeta sp. PtaU1.Bin060]
MDETLAELTNPIRAASRQRRHKPIQSMDKRETAEKALAKQGYHLVGSGAVKPCLWLNRAMRGGEQCYKHHFYGISSHRCVQMTPTLECNHLCLHCWRPIDDPVSRQAGWTEPDELLNGILHEQQRILSGYGGAETTDMSRLKEARSPKHVAVSLMGEPTLYPHLRELIELISKKGMTSFVVSNGTRPEMLERLRPTQLYISLNASDEALYRRVSQPSGNLWPKVQESLALLREHTCRSVVRMTLARGLNLQSPEDYARILAKAEPDFVEVKAYMHLGRSRMRLNRDAMPQHTEIFDFAKLLAEAMGYELAAEVPLSRVVLLSSGRIRRSIT